MPANWNNLARKRLENQASPSDLHWFSKYDRLPRDDQWYASLFEPEEGQIVGEITPNYSLLDGPAISHVRRIMPDTKLLFFLRNPMERVWSQTVMDLDTQGESFETATRSELHERFRLRHVRRRTEYLRTLENWCHFYPEEQIFIGFLEDIHFHPVELLRRVYRFLGVNPTFEPQEAGQRVNARSPETMSAQVASALARAYRADLEHLQERFGYYTSFWLYCANRLLEESFDEDDRLVYPLWESSMWEDWLSNSDYRLEEGPWSGPLYRFQKRLEKHLRNCARVQALKEGEGLLHEGEGR